MKRDSTTKVCGLGIVRPYSITSLDMPCPVVSDRSVTSLISNAHGRQEYSMTKRCTLVCHLDAKFQSIRGHLNRKQDDPYKRNNLNILAISSTSKSRYNDEDLPCPSNIDSTLPTGFVCIKDSLLPHQGSIKPDSRDPKANNNLHQASDTKNPKIQKSDLSAQ